MKNVWKKIGCIACVAILAGGFLWGVFGGSGKSAYDLAVKNGFKGTEKEWLASLKGSNGNDAQDLDINEMYNAAVAKGYTGSFMDFLKETFNMDVKDENDTAQLAENAMSVVSVACGFKKKNTTISPLADPYYYPASAGAGVIIDLDKENGNALIVTNYHVVYEKDGLEEDHISERIYVYPCGSMVNYNKTTGVDDGPDGIRATYVGGSMNYDIALLQISGSEVMKRSAVTEAVIGDSENVQMGEKVFPIGNPGGDGISVTSGIISMTSENIILEAPDGKSDDLKIRVMRTDAAINGGNSGGGLFDSQGKLIGIVNAKSVASAVDNVGYAIPINLAKAVWENIQANSGSLQRALMGVTVTIADSTASLENGKIKITEVIQVIEKSPDGTTYTIKPDALAYGKLKHGDIVKGASINGGETTFFARQYNMLDFFLTIRLNDNVKLIIEREGEEKEVEFHFNNIKNFNIE